MNFKTAHALKDKERTKDIEIQENVTFDEMYLSDSVLSGLHACGFVRPSPIQLSAIPLGRCGLDLIVQAKSGTGKTCVFAVIALEMISVMARTTQVLIVAPTREIAVQICQVINSIGSSMPNLKASTFIGGTNVLADKAKLKCCHIAIGTPGRLIQLVSLGCLNLKNVRLLVLDEADQLLNGTFKESIQEIVKTLPLNKQVLALSATYPEDVTEFLDKFMRSPSHVRLGKESPALLGVHQFVRILPDNPSPHQRHKDKFNELLYILSTVSFNQCLVFSNSQLRAESICNQLKSSGWPASFLTGGQVQADRLEAFFALCSYKCRILVSTDLSARGLDSEHVNLVINLDIPFEQATYLHRVGRAGRFGSKGIAISLSCKGEELERMRAITSLTNILVRVLPSDYDADTFDFDIKTLELIEPLSDEGCSQWLEKENTKKYKHKEGGRNKENHIQKTNKMTHGSTVELNGTSKIDDLLNKDSKQEISIQDKDISENQTKEKLPSKSLLDLHSHFREFKSNSFSFQELVKTVSEKWDSLSIEDKPNIVKNSILKDMLSESDFASLELYLNEKENKADLEVDLELRRKGKGFSSRQALENVIRNVQLCDDRSEGISIDTNNICKTLSSTHISDNTVYKGGTDGEKKCNGSVSHEPNIEAICSGDVKQKKNKYAENTGYGQWEAVQTKDKFNANVYGQYEMSNSYNSKNLNEYSEIPYCSGYTEARKNKKSNIKAKQMHNHSLKNSSKEHVHSSKNASDDHIHSSHYSDKNEDSYDVSFMPSQPNGANFGLNQYYSSTEAYIRSAQKFGMMMEYVKTLGKMSSQIAYDYNQKIYSTQEAKKEVAK